MRKIGDCLRIELLLLHRMKWLYAAFLLALGYYGYFAYDKINSFKVGLEVTLSANIVQGGIFLFLIYGILLIRAEVHSDSDEVFDAIPGGFRSKVIAKLLHLGLLSTAFFLASLSVTYVLYAFYDIPAPFYVQSALYLILYWMLPFLIAGVIGLILGLIFKTKLAFPVGMVTGILFGPLNSVTYISLTKSLPTWLEQSMFMINLGQSDPQRVYHVIYGYPIESFRWLVKIFLLVSVLLILFYLVYRRLHQQKRLPVALAVALCVGLTGAYSWSVFHPHLGEMTSKKVLNSDNNYYELPQNQGFKESEPFVVERYEMDVQVTDHISNTVKMSVTPTVPTQQLVFSLFHDLEVKRVGAGGLIATFVQEGDQVAVNFDQEMQPNRTYEVTMTYEGSAPKRFFANQHAVMLPGFLPWYPVPSVQPIAYSSMSGARFFAYQSDQESEYVLYYSGPQPMYSNLTEQVDGIWTGRSNSGVLLVSGAMERVMADELEVIRPYALYNLSSDLSGELAVFMKHNQEIASALNTKQGEIQKVFFLETRAVDAAIWLEDKYLVWDIGLWNNHDLTLKNDGSYTELLIEANVRNYSWEKQDRTLRRLFIYSFSHWYGQWKQVGEAKDQTWFARVFGQEIKDYHADQYPIYQQLVQFINLNVSNEKLMKSFYQEWLKMMQGKEQVTWENVQKLLTKYEKETAHAVTAN